MTVEACYVDSSALRQLYVHARHFVTYDQRQAKLAAACGLRVLRP